MCKQRKIKNAFRAQKLFEALVGVSRCAILLLIRPGAADREKVFIRSEKDFPSSMREWTRRVSNEIGRHQL